MFNPNSNIYRRALLYVSAVAALMPLVQAEDRIPTGFRVERYTQLWQRNPFAPAAPRAPQAQPTLFDNMFLTSWLKDNGKFVIFVQNSDTNEVQKITTEPNQDNLRLIELHISPNPEFVEAIISNATQKGAVKFRLGQPSAAMLSSTAPQTGNIGSTGPAPSQSIAHSPGNSGNVQSAGVPVPPTVNQPGPHRVYPGVPRVQMQGGPPPAQRGRVSG